MMIFYAMLLLAIPFLILSVYAIKKTSKIESPEEKKVVRAKWQVLFGILGAVAAIAMFVVIFVFW